MCIRDSIKKYLDFVQKIEMEKQNVIQLQNNIDIHSKYLNETKLNIQQVEKRLEELQKMYNKELDLYKDVVHKWITLKKTSKDGIKNVEDINVKINEKNTVIMNLQRTVANIESELELVKTHKEKYEQTKKDLQEIEEELTVYEVLKSIYNTGNITRALLIKITEQLNIVVNSVISLFFDDVLIEIKIKEDKHGGIALNVIRQDKVTDIVSYSGGEKDLISLAIRLGFIKFIENYVGISVENLFLDEPTVYLDQDKIESFVNMIKSITDKQCVLISHQPEIIDMFDTRICISKKNGFSTIDIKNYESYEYVE